MVEPDRPSVSAGAPARPWRPARHAPLAVLLGIALLLTWRALIPGNVLLPLDVLLHLHPWRFSYERVDLANPLATDPVTQVYPRRVLANQLVQQGAWPLWNPAVLTGTPLLADGQLGFFYPPSLVFLVLPLEHAYGWYAFIQVLLAGAGTFLFARRIGLGRGAATLAGVAYMLNGYLLQWLPFPHHTGATAMLPWGFWAVELAIADGRWRRWPFAGIALALPLLSHLQVAFYIWLCLAGYVGWRALGLRRWRPLAGLALAVIVALGLAAPQLLPSLQLSSQGQRADLGVQAGDAHEQFVTLLRLLLPGTGAVARTGAAPAWGAQWLQPSVPYAGLLTLALALLAMLRSRLRTTTYFGVLAIAALALALRTPLLDTLALLLPPYRQFEDHTRWFVVWGFAAAVLAGLGAEALGSMARQRPWWLWLNRGITAAAGVLVGGWGLWHLQLFTPQSRYGEYITLVYRQPLAPALWLGLASLAALTSLALLARTTRQAYAWLAWPIVLAALAADLLWNGGAHHNAVATRLATPTADLRAALGQPGGDVRAAPLLPPTRQVDFLVRQPGPFRILGGDLGVLPPNLAAALGLEDVRGYVSLYTARYNRLVRLIDGKDYRRTGERFMAFRAYFTSAWHHRRLLDMLNVRYLVFAPGSENAARYQPLELVQRDDEGTIYRNPTALPRAWLVHRVEVVPDDLAQLERLASDGFDPAQVALLAETPPPLAPAAAAEPTPDVRYGPNRVTIEAQPASAALLVLADAYADDWEVRVDGRPARLYRANYAFRGVWLPAGRHTVEMSYQPRAFTLGLVLATLTLLALAAWWWHGRRADAARSTAERARDHA